MMIFDYYSVNGWEDQICQLHESQSHGNNNNNDDEANIFAWLMHARHQNKCFMYIYLL